MKKSLKMKSLLIAVVILLIPALLSSCCCCLTTTAVAGSALAGVIGSNSVQEEGQGLSFTSNGDGTCYVSGIGSCTDTSIVIPSVSPDGERVVGIGDDAFYYFTSLTNITIPDGVTYIGNWAFGCCSSLTEVTIPDSVTYIGEYAFKHCEKLSTITIGSGVTYIGLGAFYNCYNLSTVYYNGSYSDWNQIVFSSDNYYLTNANIICNSTDAPDNSPYSRGLSFSSNYDGTCYVIGIGNCTDTDIVIPPVSPEGDSVVGIGYDAFCYFNSITSVTIPDSVTYIGSFAFYSCSGLSEITIPNSVSEIGYSAFEDCYSLNTVYYGGSYSEWCQIYIDSGNYYLTNANINCQSYDEPDESYWESETPPVEYPDYTQYSRGLNFSSNGDGTCYVSGIGSCTDTNVVIPPVAPNGDAVTGIGYEAFDSYSYITSVIIPDSVTYIGEWAFKYCYNLAEITIPDSVTAIGDGAFYYCTSLTEIALPTNITAINYAVFANCETLQSIIIPESVTSIGGYAFFYCYNLSTVYYFGTSYQWDSISIDYENNPLQNAYVVYNYGY